MEIEIQDKNQNTDSKLITSRTNEADKTDNLEDEVPYENQQINDSAIG